MSKTTLSILASLLLSGALAMPALADTHRLPHIPLRYLGGHYMPHAQHTTTATALHRAPSDVPPPNFTVYSEPNADGDTFGYGINADGDVAGEYTGGDGHTHGFLRHLDGDFTEIQVGPNPTGAFWPNDKDAVTGTYLADGILHAYVRTPKGKYKTFEPQDSQGALGLHINNKGVATGYYWDSNGVGHGFLRAKDGALTSFDEPKAATGPDQGTNAGATNVRGDTTGPYFDANNVLHGYVRHKDDTYEEFDVPGALNTVPFIINAKGWIVGLSDEETGALHGFIRNPNGEIIPVDVQGAGNGPGQGTIVQDMTKDGVAVGNYVDANDVSHGFVRSKDGQTITKFDVPGCPGGATPVSINGDGIISGYCFDDTGKAYGFVGTP